MPKYSRNDQTRPAAEWGGEAGGLERSVLIAMKRRCGQRSGFVRHKPRLWKVDVRKERKFRGGVSGQCFCRGPSGAGSCLRGPVGNAFQRVQLLEGLDRKSVV